MRKNEDIFIEEIRAFIADNLHPKKIWLFGSRAKGKQRMNSDFDIAYEGVNASFRQKRQIRDEISKMAGIYSVDLIELEEVSDDFKNLVREEGELIYEGN